VYLYEPAGLPVAPLPLGRRTRVATAGVFGLMAAVAAVLLLEYLDQSVRSVEDVERRLDLPVLGGIPGPSGVLGRLTRKGGQSGFGGRHGEGSPKADVSRTEALRMLRGNLLVALSDLQHPVVVVTSANPAEGKSATCAGLARSLASAGRRVVLVDLDLRHPELHARIGIADHVGVADVLTRRCPLVDAVQLIQSPRREDSASQAFYFLSAGQRVANTTELLETPIMARLLASLAANADIVLVDSAPALPVADTQVLARMSSGVLLVVEAGRTSATDVRLTHEAFTRSSVRVLGVALNRVNPRELRLGYGEVGGAVADLAATDAQAAGPRWAFDWAEAPG